jgi:hypothetical protein
MILARWIVLMLAAAAAVCFAAYVATSDKSWLRRGLRIVKLTVVAGLLFFAVLILERMA